MLDHPLFPRQLDLIPHCWTDGTAAGWSITECRDAGTTQAMRIARKAKAGQLFVNGFLKGGGTIPFGGVKDSGLGREKGFPGISACCATKSFVLNH
ncbi:aldehyde dehydrogenase family protein [Leisingera sp. M658]|uniref:aldehyde dehydrogenase family protein n=1 Tax=Leisingera sp. M658 TaxID=2867015 RepID=UPI0021A413D8|nr:aldehyde dehydrogenase family protein [Leisingera sp. M658]UWQ73998.1 aldehyde dehydrogenase family protein [Leisingera sp. M658]